MKMATTITEFAKTTKSPQEAVRAFARTPFRYLDFSFSHLVYPQSPFLSDGWREKISVVKHTADQHGLCFVQAHSANYNPLDPNADHTEGVAIVIRSMEACAMLGIEKMVVHSGTDHHLFYPKDQDKYFERNAKFYRSLIPTMEKTGVQILIENSAESNVGTRYFFMTGQDMNDFISYVNHPMLKACWDIGHANMRDVNQFDDLCTLGKNLVALHIQDNFGNADEHMTPFMGTVNMDAVMQALMKIDYTGFFTFEAHQSLCTATGYPHKRKVWQNPDGTPSLLTEPTLELKILSVNLCYEIGRYILERYGVYEP